MKLDRRSPVLDKLAELYAQSAVGETGMGKDYLIRYEKLLEKAACTSGERFANAVADLMLYDGVALDIQYFRNKPSNHATHVRVPLTCEGNLFALVGRKSPEEERQLWVSLFAEAIRWEVPVGRRQTWEEFCRSRMERARVGAGWKPFRRSQRKRARFYLELTAKLLAWKHCCLLRTASAQICGNSKSLERSAATIEELLSLTSGDAVRSFDDLGIEHNPTTVRFHGPVRVRLGGSETNYTRHREASLPEADLAQMESIHFDAPRCVTVENATKFHELCQLRSGDIFVFTSYPNKATVAFLCRLPAEMQLYHFGDTDPWGFDVLRILRKALDRPVLPLHMHYRAKEDSPLLSERDRRKLVRLLDEPHLDDVRDQLHRLAAAGRKGDFEQETLILTQSAFPYTAESL